tara:strand:+ start:480 stop:806 length:327 start_codon:yes stop_codon:yes gene_type:complete
MEINDFKPKDPVDTPGTESPTAVKEAVVEEAPVEDEVIVEEKTVLTVEGQDGISPSELVESLAELKDRAKAAGLRPIQNMVTSYISQGLSMVDGLLESLEGSKKKKDK